MFDFIAGPVKLAPADLARLARIERKLDLILVNLGLTPEVDGGTAGLSPEVRAAADRGDKIEAIRRHRTETGLGLAESKTAVEDYLAGRG